MSERITPNKHLDPEAREILLNYFTKVLNYTYEETKQIRLLLKLQNLTIDDIIIGSNSLEKQLNNMVNSQEETRNTSPVVNNASKINPTPSKIDIDDLEFCFIHRNSLIPTQRQFIVDNFKSRKDNAVTRFNNDPITPKMRQNLDRCVTRIKNAQAKEQLLEG